MRISKYLGLTLMGLFFSSSIIHAEFIAVQRALNPYKVQSTDVWSLDVVSTESQNVRVKLFGIIRKGGQKVVELESRNVSIKPGANALSSFTVATQRKNYLNKNIMEVEQLTLGLPPGNYELCVYMKCATAGCDGLGYSPVNPEQILCQQVKIEPPTPLQLTYPTDQAKIKQTKPTLSWIPPGPIAQSSKLKFIITLVEMNKNQNKLDAIKRNRPLLRKTGHSLTNLMFPMDLANLEAGKKYAWQVEAWVGDQWISTSEVWEFEIEEEEKEEKDSVTSYVLINDNKDVHQFAGELNFIYKENHKNGPVNYKLSNQKGKTIQLQTDTLSAVFGENKYTIDLTAYPEISDGYYELTVFDKAKKSHVLRFRYTFK